MLNFAKNKLRSSLLQLIAGSGASQLILILASPLIAKIYDPAEFGVYSTLLVVISCAIIVSSGKIDLGISISKTSQDRIEMLKSGLKFSALTSPLLSLIVFYYSNLIGLKHILIYLLIYLAILSGAWSQLYWSYSIANQKFSANSTAGVFKSFTLITSQVLFGTISPTSPSLLFSYILSQLAIIVSLNRSKFVAFDLKHKINFVSIRPFLRFSTPQSLINLASNSIPTLAIMHYYGPFEAGCYELTRRMANIPIHTLGESYRNWLYGRLTAVESPDYLAYIKPQFLKISGIVAVSIPIIFSLFPIVFKQIFDPSWYLSIDFFYLMLIWTLSSILNIPFNVILNANNKQSSILIMETVQFSIRLATFMLPIVIDNVIIFVNTISILGISVNIINICVSLVITRRGSK